MPSSAAALTDTLCRLSSGDNPAAAISSSSCTAAGIPSTGSPGGMSVPLTRVTPARIARWTLARWTSAAWLALRIECSSKPWARIHDSERVTQSVGVTKMPGRASRAAVSSSSRYACSKQRTPWASAWRIAVGSPEWATT